MIEGSSEGFTKSPEVRFGGPGSRLSGFLKSVNRGSSPDKARAIQGDIADAHVIVVGSDVCRDLVERTNKDISGIVDTFLPVHMPFGKLFFEPEKGVIANINSPNNSLCLWGLGVAHRDTGVKIYIYGELKTPEKPWGVVVCLGFRASDAVNVEANSVAPLASVFYFAMQLIGYVNESRDLFYEASTDVMVQKFKERSNATILKPISKVVLIRKGGVKYRNGDSGTCDREYSHRWEVRGHWRRCRVGKDQEGNPLFGRTWVTEHPAGPKDKELVKKVRYVQ